MLRQQGGVSSIPVFPLEVAISSPSTRLQGQRKSHSEILSDWSLWPHHGIESFQVQRIQDSTPQCDQQNSKLKHVFRPVVESRIVQLFSFSVSGTMFTVLGVCVRGVWPADLKCSVGPATWLSWSHQIIFQGWSVFPPFPFLSAKIMRKDFCFWSVVWADTKTDPTALS